MVMARQVKRVARCFLPSIRIFLLSRQLKTRINRPEQALYSTSM
jgi:hypothetical protein